MATVCVELGCNALPAGFRVVTTQGREAINALPRWEVRILVPEDVALDPDSAIGAPAALRIVDEEEGTQRDIGLLVTDLHHEEDCRDGAHYLVELAPAEALLTHRAGYRVFLDKTTKEIIAEILNDAGIPAGGVVWRLSGSYEKRLHCVQYGETEWAFIERLLADEGISYWFDFHGDSQPVLVLADDKSAHEGVTGSFTIPYQDESGLVSARHLFGLAITESMVVTATAVRDYDVRAPDVFIEGNAGSGPLEHFEYPANVLTTATAKARAQARLEQLQRHHLVAEGKSDCIRLQPGRVIQIEGCADDWMNRRYLITSLEQQVSGDSHTDAVSRYVNGVTLVPHGEVAYRPDSAAERAAGHRHRACHDHRPRRRGDPRRRHRPGEAAFSLGPLRHPRRHVVVLGPLPANGDERDDAPAPRRVGGPGSVPRRQPGSTLRPRAHVQRDDGGALRAPGRGRDDHAPVGHVPRRRDDQRAPDGRWSRQAGDVHPRLEGPDRERGRQRDHQRGGQRDARCQPFAHHQHQRLAVAQRRRVAVGERGDELRDID